VAQTWTTHDWLAGQWRSAPRTLPGKADPAGCPRQANPPGNRLARGALAGSGPGTSPCIDGLSLASAMVVPQRSVRSNHGDDCRKVKTIRSWRHGAGARKAGFEPGPSCFELRGRGGEGRLTCESCTLVVTAGARPGPGVSMPCGSGHRSRLTPIRCGRLRRSDPGSGRVVVREQRPAAGSEGDFAGRVACGQDAR